MNDYAKRNRYDCLFQSAHSAVSVPCTYVLHRIFGIFLTTAVFYSTILFVVMMRALLTYTGIMF